VARPECGSGPWCLPQMMSHLERGRERQETCIPKKWSSRCYPVWTKRKSYHN
jgi:hypothetical protein